MTRKSSAWPPAGLATVAAAAGIGSAAAHHSFAMFDADKTVTMQGTVAEFEWVNPHSWLRFTVNDEKTGRPVRVGGGTEFAIAADHHGHARPNQVKAGDSVSVTFHPMKDGSRGGQFIQATLPEREASDPRQCGRARTRTSDPLIVGAPAVPRNLRYSLVMPE